jgi:flagellar hook-associated protein 2
MGRITSSVGLVSGINSADIIDQLMQLEERPKALLQDRIEASNKQKLAYTDISTRLTSLRITSSTLKRASTFEAAATSSSDEDVLTATATNGAAIGSFQFQVARLVTSQQTVSKGLRSSKAAESCRARRLWRSSTAAPASAGGCSASPIAPARRPSSTRRRRSRLMT